MDNFYTDNPDLKFHLSHPLMKKIVALKERNYADKDKFDYAPVDFEDAMDNYEKTLYIIFSSIFFFSFYAKLRFKLDKK